MGDIEIKHNRSFAGIYREEIRKFKGPFRQILQTILIECNHSDNPDFLFDNQPFPLKRGQWITSWSTLSNATGYSIQTLRTNIGKMEKSKILTMQSTNILTKRASLITIIEPDKWLVKKLNQQSD